MTTKAASSQPTVHDRCSKCRASVSGFPGDYAKCKCGAMQMLPSDPPAGWRFVHDPNRLKTLPFFMVISFYASILGIFWTAADRGFVGAVVVILIFAMWIYSIMSFSTAAEKQPGWWISVLEYHLASAGMLGCFFIVLPRIMEGVSGKVGAIFSLPMLAALFGLFICLLVYGDARRRVAHLRITKA